MTLTYKGLDKVKEQSMAYKTPRKGGFILELSTSANINQFMFIPFIFNPEELDETDSANYAIHEIPGRADPYIQYISGTGMTMGFNMIIDHERIQEMANYLGKTNRYAGVAEPQPVIDVFENRYSARFSDFALTDDQIRGLETYIPDTADLYIEQVKKLILPSESDDWTTKSPPLLTLLFGASTFTGRIKDINVVKYLFYPNLDTKYAEISISMIRDNPMFPRFFSRLPRAILDIRLPWGDNPEIDRASYIDRRKGYVTR